MWVYCIIYHWAITASDEDSLILRCSGYILTVYDWIKTITDKTSVKEHILALICFDLFSKSFLFFPVTVFWDPRGFHVFGTADVEFCDPLEGPEFFWGTRVKIIWRLSGTNLFIAVYSCFTSVHCCSGSSAVTLWPRYWSRVSRSLTENPLQNVRLPYPVWDEKEEALHVVLKKVECFYRTFLMPVYDSRWSRWNNTYYALYAHFYICWKCLYILIKKKEILEFLSILWLLITCKMCK